MTIRKWCREHTRSLHGKTVAISGSTGGLGHELVRYLAALGADLILMDRNPKKVQELTENIRAEYPDTVIRAVPLDLTDPVSLRRAADTVRGMAPDILILNAGAYAIPRDTTPAGMDPVYQINFASPYFLVRELLPALRARRGRVVAVGSIAHTYSVTDPDDPQFRGRKRASLAYGNAKRRLMAALWELFREETDVSLSVTHPGITCTNITAHYPPWLYALIRHPMKWIFMPPRKAALSLLAGCFTHTGWGEWIGPRVFRVWGYPGRETLHTISAEEAADIARDAETACQALCSAGGSAPAKANEPRSTAVKNQRRIPK